MTIRDRDGGTPFAAASRTGAGGDGEIGPPDRFGRDAVRSTAAGGRLGLVAFGPAGRRLRPDCLRRDRIRPKRRARRPQPARRDGPSTRAARAACARSGTSGRAGAGDAGRSGPSRSRSARPHPAGRRTRDAYARLWCPGDGAGRFGVARPGPDDAWSRRRATGRLRAARPARAAFRLTAGGQHAAVGPGLRRSVSAACSVLPSRRTAGPQCFAASRDAAAARRDATGRPAGSGPRPDGGTAARK